ncbi:MAG: alanine racemase [Patescibacteria group bacterium]
MKSFFQKLRDRKSTPQTLITVCVSRSNILHNLSLFKKKAGSWRVAPVLKSNAYGHGLLTVARILQDNKDIPFFAIDSYFEARVLRTEGITMPLLVLGHTLTKTILENSFKDVAFAVATLSQLKELTQQKKKTPPLHIKIDTGMHRQGIMPDEISETIHLLTANPQIRIEGVCSHLSDADGTDPTFTRKQIETWNGIVKIWKEKIPDTRWYHLALTAATKYIQEIDANLLRLGMGLYGIDPANEVQDLKPALSLRTSITALRTISAGESVGYNNTWTATRETKVATIPAGYFEGISRQLSNKGVIRVNDRECPIVGRVSMNMTTVDVTDIPNVKEGDSAEVISADPKAGNSASKIAVASGTIPYEILVHIPAHLKRVTEK